MITHCIEYFETENYFQILIPYSMCENMGTDTWEFKKYVKHFIQNYTLGEVH